MWIFRIFENRDFGTWPVYPRQLSGLFLIVETRNLLDEAMEKYNELYELHNDEIENQNDERDSNINDH